MMSERSQDSLTDVLIRRQIITPEQCDQATALAKEKNLSVGESLTQMGVLSADDIRAISEDLLNIRTIKLEDVEIDPEAVHHVPAAVAHRHHLIPIRRSGHTLAVAMSDPTDREALAALGSVTDFEIQPFLARYDTIEHAVYLHYGEPHVSETADAAEPAPDAGRSRPWQGLMEEGSIAHVGRSLQAQRGATFDSYIEDAANQFALSIAHSVSRFEPDQGYNPFHLWGAHGVGKTHLLHAIANYAAAHSPLKRCIMISGQRFLENLFECIRDKKLNFFRYLYRELDLLMIADADALLAHSWAQRELHETYTYLERNKKQLVLAAQNNLAAEPRLIAELRLALESGVIAHVGAYSALGKQEIIRHRMGTVALPEDVVEYMASESGEDLEELMRLVQHAVAMTVLEGQEVSVSAVRKIAEECGVDMTARASQRIRTLLDNGIGTTRTSDPPKDTGSALPLTTTDGSP
ncbi:MAG: DnaA/Hda family protein [bacterium]|nr:DnaA/Hda family protein [bacterium]